MRLKNVGLDSFQYRRVLFDLSFLFEILTGHVICNVDSHLISRLILPEAILLN